MTEFAADRVLATTFSLWWRHLGVLGLLALVAFLPALVWRLAAPQDFWGPLLLALVADGPFRAAVANFAEGKLRGGGATLGKSLKAVHPRTVVTGLTVALMVAVSYLPAFFAGGFVYWLLLVLPLAAILVLLVSIPANALDPSCGTVARALGRSADLTRGRRVGVFVVLLVLGLFAVAVDWLLGVALAGAAHATARLGLQVLTVALGAVASAVVYLELCGATRPPSPA